MPDGETALLILIPSADPVIGAFRLKYDRFSRDGMLAHITILYPFVPEDNLSDEVLGTLEGLFGRHRKMDIAFSRVREFVGSLWLAPEPERPILDLRDAVARQFPDYPPYGDTDINIPPHVTLVTPVSGDRHAEIRAECDSTIGRALPIRMRAESVQLMAKRGGGWHTIRTFPLA